MSLLFELESLTAGGGMALLHEGQRDFSPFVCHLTNAAAMEPVTKLLKAIGRGHDTAAELPNALRRADKGSADVLRLILNSGYVRASRFDEPHTPESAVCLTECTLGGLLSHSTRYGRFGLVFPKTSVAALEGRPLAHLPREVRRRYIDLSQEPIGAEIKRDLVHFTTMSIPGTGDGPVQDYTHEREWRCPTNLPVSEAVALIVGKTSDCGEFGAMAEGLPVIPLNLLYRMGV